MNRLTCIIVDDEIPVLNRLENLLLKFEDIKILAKEVTPETAIEKIISLKPDIVFIDVEMPRMNGFDVVKTVREELVFPTFIFVTAWQQYAIRALKQSAFDYLLKPVDTIELKESLERYRQTKSQIDKVFDLPMLKCLCEREREILKYVIKGYTSKQIAELLFISKATVDTHRKNILVKTGTPKLSDLIINILTNPK
jgi:two-component system response regulator LytT